MKAFTTIWSYKVNPGKESDFEKLYGNEGDWVKLFKRSPDYIRTELHKNLAGDFNYITIDYWKSRESYYEFRGKAEKEFVIIDKLGEKLTVNEIHLGEFEMM